VKRATVLILLAALLSGCAHQPQHPPVAAVRPVIDDYFGTKISDPYRYMENLKDPQVQAWIKGQADYATHVLSAIPGRDALLARIRELDSGAPYRIYIQRRWPNGDMLYSKALATENVDKLYMKRAGDGIERLLVDPDAMSAADPTGRHYSLSFCVPSIDEKYIAYGIAAAGSEQQTLHILDVTTGKDLPEAIDRFEDAYTHPEWTADSSGFFYSRRRQLPPDVPATEGYKQTKAFFHRLGTNPTNDKLVFSMNGNVSVPMGEADFPGIIAPQNSRWAIGQIHHGDSSILTLYAAPLDALISSNPANVPWKKICDVADEVVDFAVQGDEIYLTSSFDAPHFRVVKTSLQNPSFASASVVVPQTSAVVRSISVARDALYVGVLDGGLGKVGRLPFSPSDSKFEIIPWPAEITSGGPIVTHADVPGVLISSSSWNKGSRIYSFDPATGALADTNLRPRGKFDDVTGYESVEVMVPSHDGVLVPLSIIHQAGLKLDGSHPTLISGYGAYGLNMDVYFDPTRIAWLERGGVIAVAHVRGGGEFGKEWHLAGYKATKPNTWKDFIACAEYLVKQGYTTPSKLAGQGTSAGGILIGRAITQRPDLFSAALVQVGCTDMLRMETTTNGVPNIQEFGSVTTKEGFDNLLAMSTLNHIVDGVKYPSVLVTHGMNDPRVEPWMSAKLTARLQAASRSGKPVLFRVDYDAGHGIGSTKRQREEQLADSYAFLLWQLGNP
jgi:prolyl oligopeptidase